ncbi:MAG: FAD-dependent oxidoreductase [Candidatus Pacebacteria bacterium]|nr:FAD-dependent oxidoreductase [Candidatus Paceibacterota bacterium]
MIYDLAIIGGGPAGVAAGVYAARKKLKTVFITESFGGQSIVSEGVENWIGSIKISGTELAKNLEQHLKAYASNEVFIKEGVRVQKIEKIDDIEAKFAVITSGKNADGSPEIFKTKTVLITTGSSRRRLQAVGADQFEHKGLTYCASCDGPLFTGQDVAVIGGGNAGFESAAQLLAYCRSVTLLHKNADFKADPVTVSAVLANPHMKAVMDVSILEVKGDKFVTGLVYKNNKTGESTEIPVTGIFVEIGAVPATSFVADVVALAPGGFVVVDPRNQRTTTDGIWAAGDCTDGLYHQNNIAAGDAVKALEDIYVYLRAK